MALVLGRKIGQEIVIGNDIVIRVGSIKGGRVRLDVDAPRCIPVRRGELPRYQNENEEPPEEPRGEEAA